MVYPEIDFGGSYDRSLVFDNMVLDSGDISDAEVVNITKDLGLSAYSNPEIVQQSVDNAPKKAYNSNINDFNPLTESDSVSNSNSYESSSSDSYGGSSSYDGGSSSSSSSSFD